MTFGKETDEEGARGQLDRFVEAGGTLIDTADVYNAGHRGGDHRAVVGRRPRDVTERVVLATKGRFAICRRAERRGGRAPSPTPALEASLERLARGRASTSTRCTRGTVEP